MRQTGTAHLAITHVDREAIDQPAVRFRKIVVRNAREIMMKGVITQPNRRPEFGPESSRRINGVPQLSHPVHRFAGAFIRVRAKRTQGIDKTCYGANEKPNDKNSPRENAANRQSNTDSPQEKNHRAMAANLP